MKLHYVLLIGLFIKQTYGADHDNSKVLTFDSQKYFNKKLKYAYDGDWEKLRELSTKIETEKLLVAAANHDWDEVKTIMQKNNKVNINGYDYTSGFPLLYAVQEGNEEIASFLLTHGAKPDQEYLTRHNGTGLMGNITYYNCYENHKTALFDAVKN